MMRATGLVLWMLLATLSFAGGAAQGQTVAVQSGEHADFTRLVLDIGADRTWALTGAGDTRILTIDPPAQGFATASVFDLIPRTRLADLGQDRTGEALTLTLACPCEITADRHLGRYLVLDIAQAAERAPRPDQETLRPEAEARAAAERQAAAARLPDLTLLLAAERADRTMPLPPPLAPEPEPAPSASATVDLDEAARIMAEQLARAAASGLLDVASDRPMSDADPVAPPAPTETPTQTAAPSPEPDGLEVAGAPIRAATALDLARMPRRDPMPRRNDLACAGSILAIRDWSAGLGVNHGLGAMRLAVYDDRDRVQRDGALALARHYLFYGFGAEAAQLLDLVEHPPAGLTAIAMLVDGRGGGGFPVEHEAAACSDEELLWRYLDAALATQTLTDGTAGRLQRATAALPEILRDQIAPQVARRLQDDGFPQAARNLRDMLQRGDRVGPTELLALDLDLGLGTAPNAETARALELALRDDAAAPVETMARALAFDRDIGAPVDPVRLVAAEALLRENGIGPRTSALWHQVVMAQVGAGALDRVLELLAAAGTIPQPTRDATLTALFADRVAAGDVAAQFILARAYGPDWQAAGSEAGRSRVAAIAALQGAGLPGAAEFLRAGQRPLILPARPADAPDPSETLRAAWAVGDWTEVSDRAAGAHRSIAARMDRRDGAVPRTGPLPDLPDLPALAAQLADSRALREDILNLLAAPSPEARE